MKLEKELGGYGRYIIREVLSFRTGATPDRIRDGRSGLVLSVTNVSAGLYRVKLRIDRPRPQRHIHAVPSLHQAAIPTVPARIHYVKDSWNYATGEFDVKVLREDTLAAFDGDAGDRISIELVGSTSTVGTDAL